MVSYRVLLCVVLVFALVPSVHAAATIADIYNAPSEATLMYGGTSGYCQDIGINCSDTEYASSTDKYSVLGDGATSAASSAIVKDSGNSQSALLKVVYDVDGLLQGTYKLRYASANPGTYDYRVCAYINETDVNVSSCIEGTHIDSDVWEDLPVDVLVRESANRFNNRINLRFAIIGSSQTITEMYLTRPFKLADIDIIPQGVTEAAANTRVENMWTFVSQAEIPDITGGWCKIKQLVLINQTPSHVELNTSSLGMEFDVADDFTYFKVYWEANTSVENMDEGFNYEVECGGYLGELEMSGFSQFVYINRENTFWENIQDIIAYLLQLIGITEDTQQLVSAQVDMVDAMVPLGGEAVATTFVTYADETVDVNASCWIDVWLPNSTQWFDEQVMTQVGSDGRYTYAISDPGELGLYQMRSFCNGTGLLNRTRYAYANLEVYQDVYMQMIT